MLVGHAHENIHCPYEVRNAIVTTGDGVGRRHNLEETTMKAGFALACLLTLAAAGAQAADPGASAPAKSAQNAQQAKMSNCNKEAGDKYGEERQAFMKECLSAGATPAQQAKMKSCNKDAGDKKGDERKAFMKECLSAKKS
jgi:hypothetical protein